MAPVDPSKLTSFDKILENNEEQQQIVYNTLKAILENILKSPLTDDYRKIHLLSKDVTDNLMPFTGGLEFLFEIGFEEDEDNLILPKNANLQQLKQIKDQLDSKFDRKRKLETCSTTISATPAPAPTPAAVTASVSDYTAMSMQHRSFYNKLQSSFNHVLIYEDKNLQAKALRIIPVERLRQNANEKFNEYKQQHGVRDEEELEFFLLELLHWYKNEFFQWVNEPDCDSCQTKEFMKYHKNDEPNQSELVWGARNVEVYRCSKCSQLTRFPRYNHPSKLLDTHKGRCGEWANCFTLCLRALNFEARYVLDWTDHVWSEVYSKSQKRWLHIDSCEAALDKPLVYEQGWGKKLTYVVAFSHEEIVDVTWRYSASHMELLKRRDECNEMWLVKLLGRMNKKRQQGFTSERKKELESRFVTELVEFLTQKSAKEGEDIGRQSGSLQWRLSRGEMGGSRKELKHIIKPNEAECKSKKLNIQYNTASNEYIRQSEAAPIKSWNSLVFAYSNIQLKVENDWKMCYLARTEGSLEAFIEWSFDFDCNNVKEFRLKCKSDSYESGEIKWSIRCDDGGQVITIDKQNGDYNTFSADELVNLKSKFILRVDLRKGNGSNAFQHTQLFRQKLDDKQLNLFELDFLFE